MNGIICIFGELYPLSKKQAKYFSENILPLGWVIIAYPKLKEQDNEKD